MKSAQDQLVLSMAHDLRTPLTGLMTFLEIARKQNSLNECTDYISKALPRQHRYVIYLTSSLIFF